MHSLGTASRSRFSSRCTRRACVLCFSAGVRLGGSLSGELQRQLWSLLGAVWYLRLLMVTASVVLLDVVFPVARG